MNDQPNERTDDLFREDHALEGRLRRYYDARRAAGLSADELRARVTARLTIEGIHLRLPSPPPSIHREIFVQIQRSDSSPAPAETAPARRSARRGGRPVGVAAALATVAVIALAALVFGSLRPAAPSHQGAPKQAQNPTSNGWTAWTPHLPAGTSAAVYLDSGAHLHFITSAHQDITGPALPNADLLVANPALPLTDASISPDGHRLAYLQAGDQAGGSTTGGRVAILDFVSGKLTVTAVTALQLTWSPDSSTVAAAGQTNTGAIWLVNAATGRDHQIAVQVNGAPGSIGHLLAWTDASHVAAVISATTPHADALNAGPQNLLGVIDSTSGQTHVIASLATSPDVFVSPDGAEALIASSPTNPTAQLVNLRSGSVTPLPAITAAFAGKLAAMDSPSYAQGGNYSMHFAWQPGTHVLALSLRAEGYGPVDVGPASDSGPAPHASAKPVTQPAGVWLLNLDLDTATPITQNTYPLAWSTDGQTLLLSSLPLNGGADSAGAGVGNTLSGLTPVAAHGTQSQLASDMVAFLGLAA